MPRQLRASRTMPLKCRHYETVRMRPRRAWIGHGPKWRGFASSWRPSLAFPFLIQLVPVIPTFRLWPLIIEMRLSPLNRC